MGTAEWEVSWFNPGTIAAFLAWFGLSGFLLTRHSSNLVLLALGSATGLPGLAGAACVFAFLAQTGWLKRTRKRSCRLRDCGRAGQDLQRDPGRRHGEIVYSQGGPPRAIARGPQQDGTGDSKAPK